MVIGLAPPKRREDAVRRARLLTNVTIGYNLVEGVVAVVAGIAAGSVSLIGFGLDSGVEVSTAVVLAWRLHQERRGGCMRDYDRLATRLIAGTFAALALWVGYEGLAQLVAREGPDASVVGIVVASLSVALMPVLARAKRRLAPALGSQAVASDAQQTELCAWMSGMLLVGLLANALGGWWWADPVAALGIAAFAARAGLQAWRAESLEDTCCA
jgi:divalent metal cation (Fe/Co/Zn/Cd) transporter